MTAREVNFDGLPGLTHHYAGLSLARGFTRHRYRCLTRSWRQAG